MSDEAPSGYCSHPRGKVFNTERNSRVIDKRGNPLRSSASKTRRVCQQPVSCPPKRGWSETSDKFKALESFCEVRTFQNGKYSRA